MSRVLQLVTRDEPGGVRVLARMVERGLHERGHAVTTLALRGERGALGTVVREIWNGHYDAILSYQVAASLLGHLMGWAARVPIRASHLTALPAAMRPGWRWLDLLWGMGSLHTVIVANSSATLGAMAHYPQPYRRRLRLIGHGVVPLPAPDPYNWRGALGIAPLAPLLVSSGRLVAQKQHALAVAALAHLPSVHLAIAGDGPLRDALRDQAKALGLAERLHLVGDLTLPQLAGLLAAGDIYAFPSTWESFGLAVVEAAMLGLPVVASDLPVLREVLAPAGPLAQFHAPGEAGDMARAVGRTLADYPASPVRRAAADRTRQAHSVEAMIDAYCRLLDGAM